jgi:hypothetical protein
LNLLSLAVLKRAAVVVGGAAVLAGATFGISAAQTAPTTPQTTRAADRQAVISLAASKLGISADQLSQALHDARKDLGLNQSRPRAAMLIRDELNVAAKTIGYADAKAMRKDLSGTTLTALAQSHNVAPATVSAAIQNDVNARIAKLTNLNATQIANLTARVDSRITAFMTHQFK